MSAKGLPTAREADALLTVDGLTVELRVGEGWLPVITGVSFTVARGRNLGIVGESGSGKTLTALSLLRLLPPDVGRIARGQIVLDGIDITQVSERRMTAIRGDEIAMIFQEPMTSLNPAFTVGNQIAEAVRRHQQISRRSAMDRAVEALARVELPDPRRQARSYPHELSGGMRQRAMIAMAIACEPKLLIADEPTTALDVTIQAQILELLARMSEELDLSVILVSHDFGVISEVSDDILVMYAGQVVEAGPVERMFTGPRHPYLAALLAAMPTISGPVPPSLPRIPGSPPHPDAFPSGCRFAPRCRFAAPVCDTEVALTTDEVGAVRCVRHEELHLEVRP